MFSAKGRGCAIRQHKQSKIELDYAILPANWLWDSKIGPGIQLLIKRFNWKNGGGRFYQVLYSGEIKNDIIIFAGLAF